VAEPDFAQSRRQLRRARVQNALTMPNQGVNRRLHRDRLLEPLALERLDRDTSFEDLAEDKVETLVAVALAEIADDPQDRAFILLECLNVLIRDGQFARMRLLAERLRGITKTASDGRPYLQISISAIASSLAGLAPTLKLTNAIRTAPPASTLPSRPRSRRRWWTGT
jgi:hypothetical protein